MSLLQDTRLKTIIWKDLSRLNLKQQFIENNITLPWLLLSFGLAYFHYYLLALPFSFLFFLTGLRQVHNGFHYTLGIGRRYTEFTLYMNSLLMITAMHAVKYNHLRHHKYCLKDEDDPVARAGRKDQGEAAGPGSKRSFLNKMPGKFVI